MKNGYILALDLGTTGNRAIVFDRSQRIVSKVYEEFGQIYPKPGWVEHDPEEIWRSVQKILKGTFKKVPIRKILAIGITNQRETVLLWDRVTGKPLHNAIVWQCRRTAPLCEALKKRKLEKTIHRKTGLFLDPYFSASKITWLLKHAPGARAALNKGRLMAGTIDSWVIWKLSGGRLHVTDSSNASRTMLFNIHNLSWDKELCRIFGVPQSILPRVVASSAVIGFMDKKLFGVALPIAGVMGDQQAAAFAQGCFSPGVVKNTYGTGLFALENTGRRAQFSKDLLTTVAWSLGHLKNTEYAVEGSVFVGGAAISWLRDGLKILKDSPASEHLAKGLPTNEGVFFVPALAGLGAPYWDARARGLIIGLTRGTTAAHLARAALEAIAYQTRDISDVMQRNTKHRFSQLRVDGGASANDLLMQFQADVLGIPVQRPKVLETTALGAAGAAGLAVGFWKDREDFSRRRRIDRVFRPRLKQATMQEWYSRWQEAVRRSRHWA